MGHALCNMEKLGDSGFKKCGQDGKWQHPRYPTGVFCDNCKEDVASFFHSNWTRIEEAKDGKG